MTGSVLFSESLTVCWAEPGPEVTGGMSKKQDWKGDALSIKLLVQ